MSSFSPSLSSNSEVRRRSRLPSSASPITITLIYRESGAQILLPRIELEIPRMSFLEDLEPALYLTRFRDQLSSLSGIFSESMVTATCSGEEEAAECRDDAVALRLKAVAIATILLAGVAGIALPLVGRKRRFFRTDSNLFAFMKAFAAGVILATGFVHMLHDGEEALTDQCLPSTPWRKFPFSGFVAMMAALMTLLADFVGTQYYQRKHRAEAMGVKAAAVAAAPATQAEDDGGITVITVAAAPAADAAKDQMHIVGMHAHAAAHRHGHPHAQGECDGGHGHGHGHAHAHAHEEEDGELPEHVRHVVVSQILELGIVSHSVIIGLSLGVSQSPCTIRPLIAALSFHQFFEGFALGGCISQAQFRNISAALMACFFAITTPTGIAVGIGISSFYNPNSPRALVVEGILDSVSAGILVYMALVDLIAADFLSRRMSSDVGLQVASYVALFLGAGAMSALAIWA